MQRLTPVLNEHSNKALLDSVPHIARTIRSMIKAEAAGVHIEDQIDAKRCDQRIGICRTQTYQ
ncbi:hypothetical protein TCT1_23990 [Xenorhabdus sp. TCT-1]|uniref:Uncharacterized protein n=1 Tax=Xenorhabdus taiwanensis TaxID=3085177 RepID=A0ABM8JYH8_9GAMM|nr:hypothetical protein TCT1_23990 [Xenorhabdus sp. TCT-1]